MLHGNLLQIELNIFSTLFKDENVNLPDVSQNIDVKNDLFDTYEDIFSLFETTETEKVFG